MKVLIAYDGSQCAQAALEDLQRAGLPGVAEVVVLSVADTLMPPPEDKTPLAVEQPPAGVQQAQAEAQELLAGAHTLAQQGCTRLQELFPRWHIHPEARADNPAWAVIKYTDTWQPDLVVAGSRGRSTLSRLLLGSVSHKILTEVRCSVRIARGQPRPATAPIRLLLGMDGSAGAQAALTALAMRVWPAGTEVCVLVALDSTRDAALFPAHPALAPWQHAGDTDRLGWATRMLAALGEPLRSAGLVVSTVIEEGEPTSRLLATAEQWHADSLWVGARGLSGMERFLLGSVSTAIATRAPCSVEVVHSQDSRATSSST